MASGRRSWKESWAVLKKLGGRLLRRGDWPTDPGELNRPEPGGKHNGACLRDRRHEEADFGNLSLPRTLVERCQFHGVSFRDTDLQLSCLSGNEFVDCDLSGAVLICADLQGSTFFACRFANAALMGADLRGSTFDHCDFTGADLTGARVDRALKEALSLTDLQRDRMVDWRAEDDDP